jgi:cytosine/adenosine deaminase-related metal-dependent hydrolase
MSLQIECDILFKNATILTCDNENIIRNVDVVVVGKKFLSFKSGEFNNYSPKFEVDASELIISPGFTNAHTHSGEVLKRGIATASKHQNWLSDVWTKMDVMSADEIEVSIKLCAAEMLHSGVTSVIDHFRQSPLSEDNIKLATQTWLLTGIRTTLALMVRDKLLPEWLQGTMPTAQSQLSLCKESFQHWSGHSDLFNLAMGPSAPTRCSLALLKGSVELARSFSSITHMHCDETETDRDEAFTQFDKTAIEYMNEFELLDKRMSLAHAVWVSDKDIEILSKTGTVVIHNPVSNLRLGSGRAPIEKFIRSHVKVMLGTDGAASNDSQNILETLKIALLLPRIFIKNNSEWPSIDAGLDMLVRNPGFLLNNYSGLIRKDYPADFIVFNKNDILLTPENDLYGQLSFAGAGLKTKYVVINGRLIVNNGKITTFNEDEVLIKALAMNLH